MARNVFLICLLLIMSCENEKPRQAFPTPNVNDINEIVKIIISTDSLSRRLNSSLSADLTKITIVAKDTLLVHSPTGKARLAIGFFKDFGSRYFSKEDSSYFIFQNNVIPTFRLDSSFTKLIKLTTNRQLEEREKHNETFCYYELSLPIFSLDRKSAYVRFNQHCFFLGGYGMTIFLKKINGKWKIVSQNQTWVS